MALLLACVDAASAQPALEPGPVPAEPVPVETESDDASAPAAVAPPDGVAGEAATPARDTAAAASPSASALGDAEAFSLTVSGGVSLGAYEAGVLYVLTEAMKSRQRDLRIATGASAGSANALVALMSVCADRRQRVPTQAIGWRLWIPIGLSDLFVPEAVESDSLLTRAPLEAGAAMIEREWKRGLDARCDVVLGVSVTRLNPEQVDVARVAGGAYSVPRQVENFAIRIQGRGTGRIPKLTNFLVPASLPQAVLPFEAGDDDAAQLRNFGRLAQLIYASAAFPLAFAPAPVAHCMAQPGQSAERPCKKPSETLFIDGGVFDNTPLRMNHRLVQRGLARDDQGRLAWLAGREAPSSSAVRYVYVDPGFHLFPVLDPERSVPGSSDLVDLVMHLTSSFVETSRSRELYALLEESDASELARRIVLTRNRYPTISSLLGAFFGFFERDFRVFDFYLGMYDSYAGLLHSLDDEEAARDTRTRLAGVFPVFARDDAASIPPAFKPFACALSQFEDGFSGYAETCHGADLRNFRILLQVALDRLHAACKLHGPRDLPQGAGARCHGAARGAPPHSVPGVAPITRELHERGAAESDFAYTMRLLSEYGFEFRDLGLRADESSYGAVFVRRRLLKMANLLADAQTSSLNSAALSTGGRLLANTVAYEPPKDWFYLAVGTTIEPGASILPFEWKESWARLNLALQIKDWTSITVPDRITAAFTPLLGPELQLLFLSSPTLQSMVGVRAGYQFGLDDSFGTKACAARNGIRDARDCSQLVLQNYWAFALVERLRGQLVIEYYPLVRDAEFDSRVDLQLAFGMQFY